MRIFALTLFVLLAGSNAIAQVNLGLPSEPRSKVELPGAGAFFGGALYAPDGPGPHPAVVLSHTCGPLRQHIFEWAARALGAGYVVLIIDHLGPRSYKTNCPPDNKVSVTEYAQDAVAGLKHLRTLTFVDGWRIALMGFSYGGIARGKRIVSE